MGPKEVLELTPFMLIFLPTLGFLGGLLSGFIGSGGAFVLTPGMMSAGVPGAMAVASNMCHKFPKALIGAIKRGKLGHVDVLLGLVMGISATLGVQIGVQIQKWINRIWGAAGSDLYVSAIFVVVLLVVGLIVLRDARQSRKQQSLVAGPGELAQKVQRFRLPPMMNFPVAKSRVSFWVTVPLGFATGLLAATIAVGGFIGVPAMMYILGASGFVASGTELVIAFVMGLVGTLSWAYSGFVDLRLALLILFGSLFGVQLGAIGTSYVKDYMIKLVMALVMLIVMVSRLVSIPVYLGNLGKLTLNPTTAGLLKNLSFAIMCLALVVSGAIILGAIAKGRRAARAEEELRGISVEVPQQL
ncbi:sulfite exporter TauE/SafE family protein [Desulfothermobacter acidiphilus]|uniref:sulfite exporter TauE/SafE family protein n=1 Tax=Desulfothermobacter acidiphilus TaxID=1938353 RepID=UPI003F88E09F